MNNVICTVLHFVLFYGLFYPWTISVYIYRSYTDPYFSLGARAGTPLQHLTIPKRLQIMDISREHGADFRRGASIYRYTKDSREDHREERIGTFNSCQYCWNVGFIEST